MVGPILLFRGTQGERWRLSAIFVFEGPAEPADLQVDGVTLPVPPRHLGSWRGLHLWRFDFAVPQYERESRVSYGFPTMGGWSFTVPALGARPRIGFVSCNGVEDEGLIPWRPGNRNERWVSLSRAHQKQPLHVLIHGGGQVYADSLWDACPALTPVLEAEVPKRLKMPFTRTLADQLMNFFFQLYCRTWSQPEVATILAAIPSVMIWDDHDIFDGWGSHSLAAQESQISRGIYQVARRHYSTFQLGASLREPPDCVWGAATNTFTQGLLIGDVGLLALDLRSERSERQVFSEATWKQLSGWLWRFHGCRKLLIVTSVPTVFPHLGLVERGLMNWWTSDLYRDDLRDQWRSAAHFKSWLQFVNLCGDFALKSKCQVTFLSGEINLGAWGTVRGGGAEMWQLISSGVVHPPPSPVLAWFLERHAKGAEFVADQYTVEMLPFLETGKRFLRARNWLEIGFDRQNRLNARWHVEGRPDPYAIAV